MNATQKPETTPGRFQVVEVKNGYAVKDMRDGTIWGRTYKGIGWASRAANKFCELTANLTYTNCEYERSKREERP